MEEPSDDSIDSPEAPSDDLVKSKYDARSAE